MENLTHIFFVVIAIILALMTLLCLVRAIIGPRIADRIVAVNMIGTLTIVLIGVLALEMNEGYLLDVGIIYAAISFLAVVILSKIYLGVYAEQQKKEEEN